MSLPDLPANVISCIIDALPEVSSDRELMRCRLVSRKFAKQLLPRLYSRASFQLILLKCHSSRDDHDHMARYHTEHLMVDMLRHNIQGTVEYPHGTFVRLRSTVEYLLSILYKQPTKDVDDQDEKDEMRSYLNEEACQWAAKLNPYCLLSTFELEYQDQTPNQIHSWAYGLAAFIGHEKLLDELDRRELLDIPGHHGSIIGAAALQKNPMVLRRVTKTVMALDKSHRFSPGIAVAAAVAAGNQYSLSYLLRKNRQLSLDRGFNDRYKILDAFARADDVEMVQQFFKRWNFEPYSIVGTIERASAAGACKVVKYLLDTSGSGVNLNNFGAAMDAAIRSRKQAVVRALLEALCTKPEKPYLREYAILACRIGAHEIFQVFIDHGLPFGHEAEVQLSRVRLCTDYLTLAVESGCLRMVEHILSLGFDIDHVLRFDTLELHTLDCRPYCYYDVLRVPVGAKALSVACRNGDTEIARALLDSGVDANANAVLHDRLYPFSFVEIAMFQGHERIIRLLLEQEGQITHRTHEPPFIPNEGEVTKPGESIHQLVFPLLPSPQDVSVHPMIRIKNRHFLKVRGIEEGFMYDPDELRWEISYDGYL